MLFLHFFRMSLLNVCVRLGVRVTGGDHLIGCLGFGASLPPRSRRGTSPCDPWPSPPSTRPRRRSTLEGGGGRQERAACQEKATQHAPTHAQTDTNEKWTHAERQQHILTEKRNHVDTHTHGHANFLHTHQDIHTWQHLRLTHKHTHIHTCRHWIQTYIETLHSC